MSDQWETFCDVGYYHMWRLRLKTERGWNDGFHINTKAEAEGLCELLNKLERELTEAREQRDRLAEEIENLKASGIHTCHDQCKRPMCAIRRQRDRLAEALDRLERTAGLAALQDDPARVQARQALAAVTGGQP
jgi:septal ring factor EnvC (AmiA/AmiB activator)